MSCLNSSINHNNSDPFLKVWRESFSVCAKRSPRKSLLPKLFVLFEPQCSYHFSLKRFLRLPARLIRVASKSFLYIVLFVKLFSPSFSSPFCI